MIGSLPPAVTFCEMYADVIPVSMNTFRDTECYATEIEQSTPVGDMSTPNDQIGAFITAVVLLVNVMLRF